MASKALFCMNTLKIPTTNIKDAVGNLVKEKNKN